VEDFMTSLSTSQAPAEPATADAGRPVEDRAARIERLREAAYRVRLNALQEGEVQGQGYIGQALGVADVLAVAVGHFGSMAEYLHNTVRHLQELGIDDHYLWRLQELVAERIESASEGRSPKPRSSRRPPPVAYVG